MGIPTVGARLLAVHLAQHLLQRLLAWRWHGPTAEARPLEVAAPAQEPVAQVGGSPRRDAEGRHAQPERPGHQDRPAPQDHRQAGGDKQHEAVSGQAHAPDVAVVLRLGDAAEERIAGQ